MTGLVGRRKSAPTPLDWVTDTFQSRKAVRSSHLRTGGLRWVSWPSCGAHSAESQRQRRRRPSGGTPATWLVQVEQARSHGPRAPHAACDHWCNHMEVTHEEEEQVATHQAWDTDYIRDRLMVMFTSDCSFEVLYIFIYLLVKVIHNLFR